ncbi:MAG TPA: hypothetical protein GXZ23_00005, partial [Clostridiales bacterium]|nr:hypothetical protein [Clostridiales bacterium]
TCETCNKVFTDVDGNTETTVDDRYLDPLGHDFGEWVVDIAATCVSTGIDKRTCSCGEFETRVSNINSNNHTGNTELRNYKAPTYSETGYSGDIHCSDCGAMLEEGHILPILSDCPHLNTTIQNAVEATCTSEGYTGDTYCFDCTNIVEYGQVTSALGHNFGEWEVVTEATCTTDGQRKHECGRCHVIEYETLTKLGHSMTETEPVDATCTVDGTLGYFTCGTCGKVFTDVDGTTETTVADRVIHAPGHTGGTATCHTLAVCSVCNTAYGTTDPNNHAGGTEVRDAVAATCTTEGYTGDTYCLGCNTIIATGEAIDKLPHAYGEWVVDIAATCASTGIDKRTCSCGAVDTRVSNIDPNNHDGGTEVRDAVAATCTTEGYTGDTYCLGCNTIIATGEAIEKLPHTYGEWVVDIAATCASTGIDKRTCSCGAVDTRVSNIDPNNHDGGTEVRDAVAATCTTVGYTGDTYCLGCGAKLATGEDIAKLDHTYIDHAGKAPTCTEVGWNAYQTCANCDYTTYAELPATGHTYSADYTVDIPATCTTAGSMSRHCTDCDAFTDVTVIPATGHTEGTPATCTTKAICATCGASYGTLKPHSYTYITVVPSTCTQKGYTIRACACGKSVKDTYTNALGHDYGEWTVKTVPTCTSEGVETRKCVRCNKTETRVIAKLEHQFDESGECIVCGYAPNAWRCSYCDTYEKYQRDGNAFIRFLSKIFHLIIHFVESIKFRF